MSEKQPKLKFEEDKERTATRSPPKKSKVEQSKTQKQKLKLDADKAAERAQHLRFGKAEITPDEASRMTKREVRRSGQRFLKESLCKEAEKESQDAGQEGCQNRKIFPAGADCGTKCKHIRHRRG